MKTTIFILLAAAALSSSEVFAQKAVYYHALGKDVAIIGQLGVPLGTVVDIDAEVVAGRSLKSKGLASAYLLKVMKVGSNAVSNAPTCEFRIHSWDDVKLAPDAFSLYELKKGKKTGKLSDSEMVELERGYVGRHFHLLVYEEGVYSGVPRDLPEDCMVWQDRTFGFWPHLIVLRLIEDSAKLNQQGAENGRQTFTSDTNRTSAADASRRSP